MFARDSRPSATCLNRLAEQAAGLTGQDARTCSRPLNDREPLGSTGLGNGIAIPHGKFAGISGVMAVFARLDEPIEFDAVDDQPVDLLMMLLAPMGAGADHLKALARVARILRTESRWSRRCAAPTTPGAIYADPDPAGRQAAPRPAMTQTPADGRGSLLALSAASTMPKLLVAAATRLTASSVSPTISGEPSADTTMWKSLVVVEIGLAHQLGRARRP